MDSDKSEHYNSITVLYRQMNKWYYYGNNSDTDTRNPEIELEENINFFLSKNIQFVRIDENHIVNLNHLEDYSLKGSEGFLIVSKMRYNIESDFITKIREARKEFQNSIDAAVLPSSMKASWLHKIKATQPNKSVNAFIDAENIMYMLRIRSRTYIYYKDNKKTQPTVSFS